VTVTAYWVPSTRPNSKFGSMNCERPGPIVRTTVARFVPSNDTNSAVAVVVTLPRFCMMNGVKKPKNRRVMLGRKTLVEPAEAPM
jgi:hypothetical protein